MARKTLSPTLETRPRTTYADYPGCLPRYKWLVEEALKSPDKMFNMVLVNGTYSCKVCGALFTRNEWPDHVNEHAKQLRLGAKVVNRRATDDNLKETKVLEEAVSDELRLTINDSLSDKKKDGIQFKVNYGLLAGHVAHAIYVYTRDGDAGEPPLCNDCQ